VSRRKKLGRSGKTGQREIKKIKDGRGESWVGGWSGPSEKTGPVVEEEKKGKVGRGGNRRKRKEKNGSSTATGPKEKRREREIVRGSLRGFLGLELFLNFCLKSHNNQNQCNDMYASNTW
jgi:hypothetical protein